ncbi:metal-sensing transcriptional repressor [Xylella taiwanensis]|uniref:Metal-sensing transcriptional repressor n=2 Tax=Xylella taiwanensis TaxID=1444770 RepID=A0ABS8TV13_9GAMM|nr:metal-sensing transcriptional repressor [Xylella taiwanensis]AXI83053.1 nickel resistance protein [Xylella taiwanensis]MCD8456083.1 metal-sensing transcriptional repressor [Xylella taiwanensis]MCD8458488.1 metal-sensing transcriptional repressor [Xylella taiwanensis]MCD8460623.1 metal-sensing transcriptional repressor [Xylella taiwanensis]MCD8463315.1 metal-sensing transcriptional repressor [Xylella taiwanensis]
MSHSVHPDLMKRLKRAQGHLATIIDMIEANRDALDIAQQLQAVIGALDKAKSILVTDHIEHHLEDVVGPLSREAREKLTRLGDLAKYL